MLVGALSLLSVAVRGLRVGDIMPTDTHAVVAAANDGEKVDGKVTKCIVDNTIVFNQVAEVSVFRAGWEYLVDEDADVNGWVINVPDIVQIEVPQKHVAAAKSGKRFKPEKYTTYIYNDIDQSGTAMQQSFSTDYFLESVRISWDSPSVLTIFIILRDVRDERRDVEIEFTRGRSRVNLRDLDFYMPMQGNAISLTVDGTTVYDKLGKWSRGLDVNVGGLTWFWVQMREMQKNGWFSPNSHGNSNKSDNATTQIMEGLQRWRHTTTAVGTDRSAELTIRSDATTVEISGNGTNLVFSKEKVAGSVIKCAVGDKVVFDQATSSKFSASWEFKDDEDGGVNGWVINIPTIVQFQIDSQSLMESDTSKLENKFNVADYTVYFDDTENMDELTSVRSGLSGDNIVESVSIGWNSHQTIKIVAHVKNGKSVEIEFTRGPGTAKAEYYDEVGAA